MFLPNMGSPSPYIWLINTKGTSKYDQENFLACWNLSLLELGKQALTEQKCSARGIQSNIFKIQKKIKVPTTVWSKYKVNRRDSFTTTHTRKLCS